MKPQTGMLVIPDDNDKTTMPDDGLHAFVCPHCGNNVFEGEDIVSYDDYRGQRTYRCWGGFGGITYKWIPHKCTACNAKFLAWKATKSINGSVIVWYIGLILAVCIMCVSPGLAVGIHNALWILWILDITGLMMIMVCIGNIEGETCDVDTGLEDMAKVADFPDDNDEEDEFRRIKNENLLRRINSINGIATQNMSSPRPFSYNPEPSSAEMAMDILRRNSK